jgi:hypothetical protein
MPEIDRVLSNLTFNDMAARREVEIIIRQDSLVLWLNVDGICRARIITNGFVPIVIKDDREKDEHI